MFVQRSPGTVEVANRRIKLPVDSGTLIALVPDGTDRVEDRVEDGVEEEAAEQHDAADDSIPDEPTEDALPRSPESAESSAVH